MMGADFGSTVESHDGAVKPGNRDKPLATGRMMPDVLFLM
jgi:hypothetical protein